MKLSNDGVNWRYEVMPLSEQDKVYRVRVGVGRSGFFFEIQPNLHRWYYIAEIAPREGGYLRCSPTKVGREKRYAFNELFEKLKEETKGV
jgi:hypothetical protein